MEGVKDKVMNFEYLHDRKTWINLDNVGYINPDKSSDSDVCYRIYFIDGKSSIKITDSDYMGLCSAFGYGDV